MSKANLTMEELYVLMNGNIVPQLTLPDEWPEWLDVFQVDLSDYIAAQLGPKVILKKYDPDNQTPFWSWWLLQFKAFVVANDYEFSKKYARLGIEYEAGQGKGYHKKVDDDLTHGKKVKFTPGVTETFTPGATYTTTHTNDKTTHSERTYDDNTITPISSDEASGSSAVAASGYDQTTRTGFDNSENSGKDQRDLEETYNETLSPFEYLEGEKRVADWSYLIELAEKLTSAVCYALWKEEY